MAEKTVLRLGTRASPLALAQAHEVAALISQIATRSACQVDIVPIRTTGDAIQDRALAEAGGKGLFTKELDRALTEGGIDLAVHSAKDLPTLLPDAIVIAGYLPREDVRDVLVAPRAAHFEDLPQGAVIGSASLRREAQIRRLRPDLRVKLLRGNVETRLRRIEAGDYDATLLALAGLKRLGLAHRATEILDLERFLPAVGQGAIAITTRAGDEATIGHIAPLLDPATGLALACERAFLAALDGSCRTPIAGHARLIGPELEFRGLLLASDGSDAIETITRGPSVLAEDLGREAGRDILARAPAHIRMPFQATG